MTTLSTAKHIQFNRADKDYSAYYDGEYIGTFATYHQAEIELDAHALDLLERGLLDTVEGITTMQWQAPRDVVLARPAEVVELLHSDDPARALVELKRDEAGAYDDMLPCTDEDGEPYICEECGSVGTPGALLIDPSDEDGALAWYCQECQNDWQAVAAFEADLDNQPASDAFPDEPLGDCALDGKPAWRLDETLTAPLCPDHKALEREWIANRDGDDEPDPNDIPPPGGPGEAPGNPSDGRGSPLQRWREQGAAEQARIAALPHFALPAASPAAASIARTPCTTDGPGLSTSGREDAALTTCTLCAYPATTMDESGVRPLCDGCKTDEAEYIDLRDSPPVLTPEELAAVDRSRKRALDEAVARMKAAPYLCHACAAPASTHLDTIPLCDGCADKALGLLCPVPPHGGHFLTCTICGGPHVPTRCPEVALVKYGMGVWNAYLEDRAAFLRLVQWATAPRLALMGEAVAFYLSARWRHDITAQQGLAGWQIKNAASA